MLIKIILNLSLLSLPLSVCNSGFGPKFSLNFLFTTMVVLLLIPSTIQEGG